MCDAGASEIPLVDGEAKLDQFLREQVVFQEDAEMQNVPAFLERGHLEVEEPWVLERNFNKALQPVLLPEDSDNVVCRQAVVVVGVRVVPL